MGVGVDGNEEIGLVVVGDGGPLVEGHVLVPVSRQEDLQPLAVDEVALQSSCEGQGDVLLERPAGALGTVVAAAVTGIDDDHTGRHRLCARALRAS